MTQTFHRSVLRRRGTGAATPPSRRSVARRSCVSAGVMVERKASRGAGRLNSERQVRARGLRITAIVCTAVRKVAETSVSARE
jgi:hypothetical protein